MEGKINKAPIKSRPPNRNGIRSILAVLAFILAACGGGGGGGPTPRPTWENCDKITPRAPVVVPAVQATESLGRLLGDLEVDLSCVATGMPIIAATDTPSR